MTFIERFWIISLLSGRYLGNDVCHVGQAYSVTRLITDLFIPTVFRWYNTYIIYLALNTMLSVSEFQLRPPLSTTSYTGVCLTRLISVSLTLISGIGLHQNIFLQPEIIISLVLSTESWIRDI